MPLVKGVKYGMCVNILQEVSTQEVPSILQEVSTQEVSSVLQELSSLPQEVSSVLLQEEL